MIAQGYKPPKWILENSAWPTKWINLSKGILEESWIIDMVKR
jgi:hypothetical protein